MQVARALAIDPDILLMDEPFAALDALTKRHMQKELLVIWQRTGKTIVFVTHDIAESIMLSDRIVVMTRGVGVQRSARFRSICRGRAIRVNPPSANCSIGSRAF
ncbi:MAG: hypothetical protein ROZ09_10475 [Thiobacillus sp.]|uniref:hypothetical protein n=1 Tax=Thiobacillus sp. TaxID=924 RepID=UPI00289627E5|nr:hypothetical protein [Thiobacillus sp.]MDT3707243.1 hypothetical protein [Thiobacillus sp.]